MKEILELRINEYYANLLFENDEGKKLNDSVRLIQLSKDDPRYKQIPLIAEEIKRKYDCPFFYGWDIKRVYTKKEIERAKLLHLEVKRTFEPTGEECGTNYEDSLSCKYCGGGRKQIGPLVLKNGSIPGKDIAKTIGSEVVVSKHFVTEYHKRNLKGALFGPVMYGKDLIEEYYQIYSSVKVDLSSKTLVGINPFNLSESDGEEIYKCPMNDNLGLNLLSEPYVCADDEFVKNYDFFISKQTIGVTRGVLQPEPLLFCSQLFMKMIHEEKLTGFLFEIAHLVNEEV